MSGLLYHVSPQGGLDALEPRASTHGVHYVYAVRDLAAGLLFGAKQDDFDFIISTLPDGRTELCECWEGALEARYAGRECSVYTVAADGFLEGMTGWPAELVSERAVAVLSEERVGDLLERILAEEARGALTVRRYSRDREYRATVARHITDRLIRFDVDIESCLDGGDERFRQHYAGIVRALAAARDGSLL